MEKDLWHNLNSELRHKLESNAQTFEFKRNDFIYRQAEDPKGIYFIKKGLVSLILTGPESGKEHLMRFFRQGQFIGHSSLFSNEGYHGSTMALEPTTLKLIPKKTAIDLVNENPHLLFSIVNVLSRELRRSETMHVMILENEILVRVAQSLIYLKNLHPEHSWTRQEIANFCASTVSTVIKALAELETMNLIIQEGRKIEIINHDGLLKLQDRI